ncbi:3-deoxy-7-phosphoheptulonate synthase [Noviherbaspirillum sedimenti]|uniref:Phospho-2-dehydro-3-deoxyheptonate aldolase n=1 Tax=Noviherbaspirillum sedimenti TaxID=2320865 RepID=A0A3A3FW15_9BURK|nr:3-deoxy-7-phosphoheptulonate synthase [Noviherbaspirillum sedimenti]RJG00393.1 3-deoxy-7-phosphoheptulonate synthase [Noviherbaspirillum sedimenti]
MTQLINARILAQENLPPPSAIQTEIPHTKKSLATVLNGRATLEDILDRKDQRRFVVVGPCSIHDPAAALDYARRLKPLADEVADVLVLVMRVYFEKPRTTVGWKGLINDPDRDDSFNMTKGIRIARTLLRDISEMGLAIGTEALDPLMPQYLGDLISWNAIGARTTESQTHREMASGLSTPVGLKNGTDGGLAVAINAMQSARTPHAFLGMDADGLTSVIRTAGNPHGHLILRGGQAPNYGADAVAQAEALLDKAGLPASIVVDCSHGNSNKDHKRQVGVLQDVVRQIRAGNQSLVGMMIESNIVEGAQKIQADLSALVYGQSVTDACIGWDDTLSAIREAAAALRETAQH